MSDNHYEIKFEPEHGHVRLSFDDGTGCTDVMLGLSDFLAFTYLAHQVGLAVADHLEPSVYQT
jgi:hypothetical protein